ncbi:MAG: hypothetical protein HC929_16755 [Leptolyngbyaceae cyanobacterium SM2_5_2]|nr:hypothetical protein [Leptolyngbyaceae cyanobacterium SM2_5_2]
MSSNILHCLRHGTQIGWLIDPDEKTVFVYCPKQEIDVFDQPTDKLPVPAFATDLSLTISNFLAGLWNKILIPHLPLRLFPSTPSSYAKPSC